ncbi:unnamed protein product [Heligmosomoides polygyrus]|uniref:Transposase n=1 Tax=Heligmosomoides polygyrus TaxID=6339 RepID=A0A183F7V9_HELPZ|nr:unnamed protein product [Heligmosomoides polygyrus]
MDLQTTSFTSGRDSSPHPLLTLDNGPEWQNLSPVLLIESLDASCPVQSVYGFIELKKTFNSIRPGHTAQYAFENFESTLRAV